jgi:hypothetical protein
VGSLELKPLSDRQDTCKEEKTIGRNTIKYCYDGLGSIAALSDVNSDVVEMYEYDASTPKKT